MEKGWADLPIILLLTDSTFLAANQYIALNFQHSTIFCKNWLFTPKYLHSILNLYHLYKFHFAILSQLFALEDLNEFRSIKYYHTHFVWTFLFFSGFEGSFLFRILQRMMNIEQIAQPMGKTRILKLELWSQITRVLNLLLYPSFVSYDVFISCFQDTLKCTTQGHNRILKLELWAQIARARRIYEWVLHLLKCQTIALSYFSEKSLHRKSTKFHKNNWTILWHFSLSKKKIYKYLVLYDTSH